MYVTGTDTGIGKTRASCALLRSFALAGKRAIGMKPVASGCEVTAHGLRNDDALQLIAAGNVLFGAPLLWGVGWALLMLVIALGRIAVVLRYFALSPPVAETPVWYRRFLVGALLAGAGWGVGCYPSCYPAT